MDLARRHECRKKLLVCIGDFLDGMVARHTDFTKVMIKRKFLACDLVGPHAFTDKRQTTNVAS